MNPAFDAEVYLRPKVCSTYPLKRNKPAIAPPRMLDQRFAARNSFRKTISKMSVAAAKRSVRNSSVETSASACLTSMNVEPQIRVMEKRLRSTIQVAGLRPGKLSPGGIPDRPGKLRLTGFKCTPQTGERRQNSPQAPLPAFRMKPSLPGVGPATFPP